MDLDLEKYLMWKTSALPLNEVIMVGKSLADALQVMHAIGIVHRDLTLDNVLLRTNDDKTMMLKCKVSDFGIARRSGFTMTGVAGKPGWIAPELHQADGGIAQPTREADIYSFGLVRLFTPSFCNPNPRRSNDSYYNNNNNNNNTKRLCCMYLGVRSMAPSLKRFQEQQKEMNQFSKCNRRRSRPCQEYHQSS
jgi:serine/threonine protein kinase